MSGSSMHPRANLSASLSHASGLSILSAAGSTLGETPVSPIPSRTGARQKVAFIGSPTRIHTSEQLIYKPKDSAPQGSTTASGSAPVPRSDDMLMNTPSAKHDWLDHAMQDREDEYDLHNQAAIISFFKISLFFV
ncbi:MAG: hypothetical protein Q8P67_23625 [archaeon]|nr:hypothetical protein [archaeon]